MTVQHHVQRTEEGGTLRLAWDNRTAPKDNSSVVIVILFWTIWTAGTIFATYLLAAGNPSPFLLIVAWCVLGWLITIGIPLTFLGRFRSEWIEISPTGLVHGSQGLLAWGPKTYLFGANMELAIGRMLVASTMNSNSVHRQNRMIPEGNVTLSLFWTSSLGIRRRTLLAYWLAPALKEQLFQALGAFVEKQGLPLGFKRFGE